MGERELRTNVKLTMAAVWLALPVAGCGTRATAPLPHEQILTGQMTNQSDVNVVTQSYRIVQLDNQEGQLAATQSSNPQVRALAAEIIGKANQLYPLLEAQVRRTGIRPPRALPGEMQRKIERISGLHGRAFDRQYLADQIESHQQAVKVFQDAQARTEDQGVKDTVMTALPVVQEDLEKLQELQGRLG